jgi:hypothetical protein
MSSPLRVAPVVITSVASCVTTICIGVRVGVGVGVQNVGVGVGVNKVHG